MSRVENPSFVRNAFHAAERAVDFYNQTKILKPATLTATMLISRFGSYGLLIDGGKQVLEGNIGQGAIEILAGLKAADIDNRVERIIRSTYLTNFPLPQIGLISRES